MIRSSLPIVVKELRSANRGLRTPLIITGFILLLYLILIAAIGIMSNIPNLTSWIIGSRLFITCGVAAGFFAGLSLPLLAALSIAGEKEKRTWDLISQTPLSTTSIVTGKVLGTGALTLLILCAAMPLLGASFVLGGVSLARFLTAWFSLALSVFALSVFGLSASASSQTQGKAVSAILGLLILAGIPTLVPALGSAFGEIGSFPYSPLLYIHPVFAFVRAGAITTVIGGMEIPEWILGDLFLLLLVFYGIADAASKLVRRENDRSPWLRIWFIAIVVLASISSLIGKPEPGFVFLSLSFVLLFSIIASPRFDLNESAGRPYFFSIQNILRNRATSLPAFFLIITAIMAGAGPYTIGVVAVTAMGIAWLLIFIGLESIVGNLTVTRIAFIFLLSSMVLTSLLPGMPHSIWPIDNSITLIRSVNPSYVLTILSDPKNPTDIAEVSNVSLIGSAIISAVGLSLYWIGALRKRKIVVP